MIGQISKAMDRSSDAVLHRVRPQQGSERINMHNRPPQKGPRIDQNRTSRPLPNGRPIGMPNGSLPNGGAAGSMMQMTPQQQMQLISMYEEQARMMSQIFSPQQQQQIFMPGMAQASINPAFRNGAQQPGQQPGRSLFERVESNPQRQTGHPNKPTLHHGGSSQTYSKQEPAATPHGVFNYNNGDISSSMEVESSQNNAPETPSEMTCRYNLTCTRKDCPYAHQSPAAPPGITIDVQDECPFGAACKNRKCVGRHPSPAQKVVHQSERECRFFPHCTNSSCPFRHPTMPVCRNGADCKREGCKFTHVKTMCKYHPCLNAQCPYKHAEGQRGIFGDKVWVADDGEEKGHVSERKFVENEMMEEELVLPDGKVEDIKAEDQAHGSQSSSIGAEVVT